MNHTQTLVSSSNRRAISLLEVVVIVVILFVLLAISIPTLSNMRELSRRRNCEQNLAQIALALQAYASDTGRFPVGTLSFNLTHGAIPATAVASQPKGYHHNWITSLLPRLGQQGLFEHVDADVSVYASKHDMLRASTIPRLRCPSASGVIEGSTTYAGITGGSESPISVEGTGLFVADLAIRPEDVSDGLAFTILVSEKLSPPEVDLSWMSGTRSSLRRTGIELNAKVDMKTFMDPLYVGGLSSHHLDGVNVAMGDGSVQFFHQEIEPVLLESKGHRNDQSEQAALDSSIGSTKP